MKWNFTSGKGGSWKMLTLTVLLIITMMFVAATFYQLLRLAKREQEWNSLITDVQVSSQQLAKSAGESASGNLGAFEELTTTFMNMKANMNTLRFGSPGTGLPPIPRDVETQMSRLNQTWTRIAADTTRIMEREAMLLSLAEASAEVSAQIPTMQESSDQVVRRLTESGAPNQQVFAASRQLLLSERMLRYANEILQGGSNAVRSADNLGSAIDQFEQVLNALRSGNQRLGITRVRNQQALTALGQVKKQFEAARPHLQTVLDFSADLFSVRGAADAIILDSHAAFDQAAALSGAVSALPSSGIWPSMKGAVLGLLVMVGLMGLLLSLVIAAERRRASAATSSNRHNQRAILTLLDELSSLADGDLTVQATVNNELTGAIADAINYAIEQLRELVMGINSTANAVVNSAQATRQSTSSLAEAATRQADKIDSATESVKLMAVSFDEVAVRSLKSSEEAHRAVEIAHSGAKKVRETISGMEDIREQIQQTSKRIKRLGESIQEIGDIVSLIDGIAEQTNVLALNAAIQAASAGEAGRGFAVVADEVQQLAESATNATRRIDALVQNIQADTSGAVASMESTTSEVVSGTRLAEDAGMALVQIENMSNTLSDLIQEIAGEAQLSSAKATSISELIHSIRDVSIQTSEGSRNTAIEVENLAELLLKLRRSVADFKLPEPKE